MKNYRFLVPIVLVVMLFASIYVCYDNKASEKNMIDAYLQEARSCREKGILVDAEQNYLNAVEISPKQEIYAEVAEFYAENNMARKARNWCEAMLEVFPEDPGSYQYLMQQYVSKQDYIACFDLLETMHKRKILAPEVEEMVEAFEYVYYLSAEYDDVSVYGGGYSPVKLDGQWAYVNTKGVRTTGANFEKAGPFSGDLAPVVDINHEAYFIDPNGNKKKVVENLENIVELGLIENGLFSLYNGKCWGFYNLDGTHVFGEYTQASNIGNGMAAGMVDGKWHVVDYLGNETTGKTYAGVLFDEKNIVFRNNRLFVKEGNGYRMIDPEGNSYGEIYEDARLFADATWAAVKIGGKWGFVDNEGNLQIEPQFEAARSYSNGLAAVQQNGLWGFIDQQGKMVIKPQFADVKDFSGSGSAFVNTGKEWELLVLYKYNH